MELDTRKIFLFWLPLSVTWLLMAVEGPFLAAVIARMADPKINLASYGVAFALAMFIESPIIMIMSAATALVKNHATFIKLRNFTFLINALITIIMGIILLPPVFHILSGKMLSLEPEVSRLTHRALLLMLPWPSAIGYRRFYQGILIINGLTRRVALGTGVRLVTMAATALILFFRFKPDGALVGALALTVGVVSEAAAVRIMAAGSISRMIKNRQQAESSGEELRYRNIISFYYPLALTSILSLGVHPLVTFFMGWSPNSLESLAVLPVINSFVFIFRSAGLSYQEVGIALMGTDWTHYRKLRNFAVFMGLTTSSLMGFIVFSPLIHFWLKQVSGLNSELSSFALFPLKMMILLPAQAVIIAFQRAVMVYARKTTALTIATIIEMSGIALTLYVCIVHIQLTGVVSAALAYTLGRLTANLYLSGPYRKALSGG